MTVDDILCHYGQDLNGIGGEEAFEFPITKMSRSLSIVIDSFLLSGADIPVNALDVGTGSGIHAAIMAAHGVRNVKAIDINSDAIDRAEARFERLRQKIGISTEHKPCFQRLGVDAASEKEARFDFIVTNPPSFFRNGHTKPLKSPLYDGVYVGSTKTANSEEKSFLHRFFGKVVSRNLKIGGTALCTWPGLEHRLVHDSPTCKRIVHPAVFLERWFDWSIKTKSRDTRKFYSHRTEIGDYGLGEFFRRDLNSNLERGGIYSTLVKAGTSRSDWQPTFKFGIVALRRVSQSEFEWLDFDDENLRVQGGLK